MDTIIRCHVKNKERLDGLQREFQSWHDKKLFELGSLFVVDDGSPMEEEVKSISTLFGVANVYRTSGTPDTKNGLYYSLVLSRNLVKDESLYCVDDAVFGNGIKDRLQKYITEEKVHIPNRGLVGTFACYEDATRNPAKVLGTDLWKIPIDILYALVAHIFSTNLRDTLIWEWEQIREGKLPYPSMCDDLWVKSVCRKYGLNCYNTMKDYAQHMGGRNRTFGESGDNSNYYSKMFVGE